MELKYDSEDYFSLPLGTFLSSRGIDLGDVNDIVVMVKNNDSDADNIAIATKTLGSGVIKKANPDTILFNFEHADFGVIATTLQAGNSYKLGVGIKTASLTKYLEPDLKDDVLTIKPDFIHD